VASKRGIRRRRCTGKKKSATAQEAARDAADMRRKQKRDDISDFRCPDCGGIHVGHTPRRVKPAPAAGETRR
jgi:hypothetical protein